MLQSGPCTSSEEDEKKEKEDMSTFLRVDWFYLSSFCNMIHRENSNFAIISLKREICHFTLMVFLLAMVNYFSNIF